MARWLRAEIRRRSIQDIRSSNLDTVHAVEMALLKDSEMVCDNPLCDVRFPQTGMTISPKRFCCNDCKQQTSIIKRAAALLVPLGKERAWEIIFVGKAGLGSPFSAGE